MKRGVKMLAPDGELSHAKIIVKNLFCAKVFVKLGTLIVSSAPLL
jgi:hypothetical protein